MDGTGGVYSQPQTGRAVREKNIYTIILVTSKNYGGIDGAGIAPQPGSSVARREGSSSRRHPGSSPSYRLDLRANSSRVSSLATIRRRISLVPAPIS